MNIKIEKLFEIPFWDEFVKFNLVRFWTNRGIKFDQITDTILTGKRGNLFGNFISFDMSKLMSKLVITVSPENEIHCVLDVDTFMQKITEYNLAWFDLEMDTFQSYMMDFDEQDERWTRFDANYKKAAWIWSLSLGIHGDKIPPEEKP